MKCKVSPPGADFRGALAYDLRLGYTLKSQRERPHVRFLGGIDDPAIFEQVAAQRPDIKKPVQKFALSAPPGEKLTDDQWRAMAADFMEGMGLSDHPHSITLHSEDMPHDGRSDKGCQHIHIAVSRVSYSGQVWLGQFSQERAAKLCTHLEKKHGLTQTAEWRPRGSVEVAKPTKPEIDKAIRTKKLPPRMEIQKAVDAVILEGATSWEDMAAELDKAGIDVTIQKSKGVVTGCSFLHRESGLKFSGRNGLGGKYSAKNLQGRMSNHEHQDESGRTTSQPGGEQAAGSAENRNAGFADRAVQSPNQRNAENRRKAPAGFSRIEDLGSRGAGWVDAGANYLHRRGLRRVHRKGFEYPAYFSSARPVGNAPVAIERSDGALHVPKFDQLTDAELEAIVRVAAADSGGVELSGTQEFCARVEEAAQRLGLEVKHPYQPDPAAVAEFERREAEEEANRNQEERHDAPRPS